MNYLDTIKKYGDGRKYAGNNIQTSDGVLAYITDTGIAKPYDSQEVYKATANKNGCKSTPVLLEPTWSDLGFPVGSKMVSGQSCGNETNYVQSGFPTNDFDASFYISNNQDLQGLTEEQALNHWNTIGKKEGRLPNSSILASMSTLGKVGYVGVDSWLHNVPSVPTGNYSSSIGQSNVIGKNMVDCTPTVSYGQQLIITQNNLSGFINDSSILQFGTKKTTFVIRPLISRPQLNWNWIRYGDEVSITTSTNNAYETGCGWWGCKVGNVNSENLTLEFGPGGESGGTTFFISPPRGSVYQVGNKLNYGSPFTLVASVIKADDILYQNQSLSPGHSLRSPNGHFFFAYQPGGKLLLYDVYGTIYWEQYPTSQPNRVTLESNGTLVVYDKNNFPVFSTPEKKGPLSAVSNSRMPAWLKKTFTAVLNSNYDPRPYKMVLQNDGNLIITNHSNDVIWSTNTAQSNVSTQDVSSPNIAYVNDRAYNIMSFGDSSDSGKACVFAFKPTNGSLACRINELKSKCDKTNCTGFLLSPSDNTWQPISSNSTPDDFAISEVSTNAYVKTANANISDKSCNSNPETTMIDTTQYYNYLKGDDFKSNGQNQCTLASVTPIAQGKSQYDKRNNKMTTEGRDLANKFSIDNEVLWRTKTDEVEHALYKKTNEYDKYNENIKKFHDSNLGTYEQQKIDASVINTQNRIHAVGWAVLAAVTITVVVTRSK